MLSMQQRGQEVAQMVEDANGEQREYVPKVSANEPIASNNGLQRENKQDRRALPLDTKCSTTTAMRVIDHSMRGKCIGQGISRPFQSTKTI